MISGAFRSKTGFTVVNNNIAKDKTISLKTTELIDKTTILVEGSKNDIEALLKMANQLSKCFKEV